MKLRHINTVVNIIDDDTNDIWLVEFTGTHTQLVAKLLKNDKYVYKFTPTSGHANKTMALNIIKYYINLTPTHKT